MEIDELKNAITRLYETKDLLSKFSNEEQAVDYMKNETGLSEDECKQAYNIIMQLDTSKVPFLE